MAARTEAQITEQINALVRARATLGGTDLDTDDSFADAILALEWAGGRFVDLIPLLRQRSQPTARGRVHSPGSAKERVGATADGTKGMQRGVSDPWICSCGALDESKHKPWCKAS